SFLREERVWPKTKFYAYFNEKCEVDTEQEKPLINLLVDVLGYKILKNHFSLLKDNDLVFFDDTIDRDLFFRICHESFITLEKNDFPTKPEDLITSVKSNLNQFPTDDSLIDKALNVINDFEVVIRNDTKFYQVAFHRLRSAGDMVYRILFENENWMKLSDINHEIKHRLSLKNKKVTDWKNLYAAIKNDKHLLPLAKSGVWTLTEWGEENLIIYELITNTLLHFNKPLIKEDIFSYILKTRPFIRTHSLNSAIYNSRFMQLRDKKFILSEWKDLYQKKTAITRKRKTY
ncbi:MAG: hypothetical protein NTY07_08465, partial [Bacteroidia bacterium]|nr:hypothetical protein [Bacteroidia bacterium]